MPTVTLTDISLRNLKPVPGKRVTYLDKSLAGFGVRITENGLRSFVLTYGDDRKRVKLGDVGLIKLSDAREKAKNILAKRQLNGDEETASVLFDTALETFLKAYAEKNRASTVYETERLLKKHLATKFKGKKLTEATKRRMVDLIDGIEKVTVRRHLYTACYTFFRWCRRYDLRNPLEGVEKPPKSPSRDRLFTDAEFRKVWQATLQMGEYGRLYRVLLVSGQRLGQIANLDSAFIDRGKRQITWPAKLMKTNKEFILPYGPLLHSLLPQGEGLLFPSEKGGPWDNWTDPHLELLKLAKVPHFTRHDCRRFYSSKHSEIGTPPHIREILLSHAFGSEVTMTYDRYTYLAEKKTHQLAYEAHLEQLLAAH